MVNQRFNSVAWAVAAFLSFGVFTGGIAQNKSTSISSQAVISTLDLRKGTGGDSLGRMANDNPAYEGIDLSMGRRGGDSLGRRANDNPAYEGIDLSMGRRGGDSLGRRANDNPAYEGIDLSMGRRGGDSLGRRANDNPAYEGIDLSMGRMSDNVSITVFPNPSNGIVNLAWAGFAPEHVVITNLQGQVVRKLAVENGQQADLSALPKGIYLVVATSEGVCSSSRLILE